MIQIFAQSVIWRIRKFSKFNNQLLLINAFSHDLRNLRVKILHSLRFGIKMYFCIVRLIFRKRQPVLRSRLFYGKGKQIVCYSKSYSTKCSWKCFHPFHYRCYIEKAYLFVLPSLLRKYETNCEVDMGSNILMKMFCFCSLPVWYKFFV